MIAWILILMISLSALPGFSQDMARADAAISKYSQSVADMNSVFEAIPKNVQDKEWVKRKIQHMVDVDQYIRKAGIQDKYSPEEGKYLAEKFRERFSYVDKSNTKDLKELMKVHGWFRISEFGKETAHFAWLLVQHADRDVPFQKDVLQIMERLYPVGEAAPGDYAYLFDRVATNEDRPQRYGTQGKCVGSKKWKPNLLEDGEKVDELRKSMDLGTLEEYKKRIGSCR